ncbi:MAG: helix-turn-helix domain containing protein [Methanosarcina sp.]|jgi:hypothetical protein|nr:helix-turn-helix domain containing protein [Methanosarcina sp.]MDD3873264.1 helix-turn-helix domain containing protein [Methanosarcina sp.]MDD4522970.1 helix-turn-helix domain containing protein [Methanosarcina sp.]
MAHIKPKIEGSESSSATNSGRVFCERTNAFFYYLHKKKFIIQLALKMAMKGMSIEAIADVLEVQPVTVNNWVTRAAKQCELVNEELMKNLYPLQIEWKVITFHSVHFFL